MELEEWCKNEIYHDSRSAWKFHGFRCYHYNCYNDLPGMKAFVHHVQAQPNGITC